MYVVSAKTYQRNSDARTVRIVALGVCFLHFVALENRHRIVALRRLAFLFTVGRARRGRYF